MNVKKSFLLYFDNYDSIAALPPAQRGELFLMLMEYARAAAEGKPDWGGVVEKHPDLAPETKMAFCFIAQGIRRDTEKWQEKHQRYKDAALRRMEEGKTNPGWRKGEKPKEQDLSWMKEYLRRD